MNVAAVIVNWNAGRHLLTCVESLQAEGVSAIVVADNDSRDGSVEALEAAHPEVTVVRTGANLGYGAGTNRGAAAVPAGHDLLVCNPDVELQPGALAGLRSALDAEGDLAVVGPRIENPDGSLYPSARTFPRLGDAVGHAFLGLVAPRNRFTRRYRMLDWDHDTGGRVDWVSGSCFLMRRAAWDEVGGFDEAYFMYAEDVDLCWRAHQAGWSVAYVPKAVVVHLQGLSTSQRPYRMIAEHHRALLRFAARSSSGPERALLPLVAAGLGLRTVLAWVEHVVAARRPAAVPTRHQP